MHVWHLQTGRLILWEIELQYSTAPCDCSQFMKTWTETHPASSKKYESNECTADQYRVKRLKIQTAQPEMNRQSFKVNRSNFGLFCQSSWHSNMANVTYCWQIYESSGSLKKLLPYENDDSQNESYIYSHLRHGSHRMCPIFDKFIRAVGGPPITCFSVCETPQSTVVLVQCLEQITYYRSYYFLAP